MKSKTLRDNRNLRCAYMSGYEQCARILSLHRLAWMKLVRNSDVLPPPMTSTTTGAVPLLREHATVWRARSAPRWEGGGSQPHRMDIKSTRIVAAENCIFRDNSKTFIKRSTLMH